MKKIVLVFLLSVILCTAATGVKVEIYKDSKPIYSDYLSLYQFEAGWKIVNKIFYKHN